MKPEADALPAADISCHPPTISLLSPTVIAATQYTLLITTSVSHRGMRKSRGHVIIPVAVISCFLFNEFLVYYLQFYFSCGWDGRSIDVIHDNGTSGSTCLQSLVLSDPHILGNRKGHFFDKLRREWQMHRSFVTAGSLFQPDMVLMLGDILDEGLIASDPEFEEYTQRFHSVFPVSEQAKSLILVGNHDIGFHNRVLYFEPKLRHRFEKAFNTSLVHVSDIPHSGHKYTFISINSMAMHGDNCSLCSEAESHVQQIGRSLSDSAHRPILLSHFPLFRTSDELCSEPDSAEPDDKLIEFRDRIDCMSEESSELLISNLKPQLVLTGHTHNGCVMRHSYDGHEVVEHTVASFSWRNRADPTFLLISFCPNNIYVTKCFIPNEVLIILVYTAVSFAILGYSMYSLYTLSWRLGFDPKLLKSA